jgi:hypothetical protein
MANIVGTRKKVVYFACLTLLFILLFSASCVVGRDLSIGDTLGVRTSDLLGIGVEAPKGGLGLTGSKRAIERIVELSPGSMRFPGGANSNGYHWLEHLASNHFEVSPEGKSVRCLNTDVFVDLCRMVGGHPSIVVNFAGATPEEAAAWVAYTNAHSEDNMAIGIDDNGSDWKTVGDWARLRRGKGHPEPYTVKIWEIGNEAYCDKRKVRQSWFGKKYPGLVDKMCVSVDTYVDRFKRFAYKMRTVDPRVKLGAVGYGYGDGPGFTDRAAGTRKRWNLTILTELDGLADAIILHRYGSSRADLFERSLLRQPENFMAFLKNLRKSIDDLTDQSWEIWVTEYNMGAPGARAWAGAFYVSRLFQVMAENGVKLAHVHKAFSGLPQGNWGIVWQNETGEVILRPIYQLIKLLSTEAKGMLFRVVPNKLGAVNAVAAIFHGDGYTNTSFILTNSSSQETAVKIKIPLSQKVSCTLSILSAPSLASENVIRTNKSISLNPSRPFELTIPPWGIAVAKFTTSDGTLDR